MQNPQELHVAEHPVGIKSRVEELISDLRLDSDDVSIVVASGPSGIGKTTIVKATYNRIVEKFDSHCFVADIHYLCGTPNWKVVLQNQLISCLAQYDKSSVMHSHTDGVTKIRKLISGRKVVFVLDDVDNFGQLEALGINPAWFHPGSRIIVTTRDLRSLGNLAYTAYNTRLLNDRESLKLFVKLTFGQEDPVNKEIIEKIVRYAAGYPLVLDVWSRQFSGSKRKLWPRLLQTLKRIPHSDVQGKLKMSYDPLTDRQKKLFLDIACFFVRMKEDLVVKVLEDEDSTFYPDVHIRDLVLKGLVSYEYDSLSMNHVIKEMGQEIVRKENEDEPGRRTRLWDPRDVLCVLTQCLGTKSVESIILSQHEEIAIPIAAFRNMGNLRLIKLDHPQWSYSNDDMCPFSFKRLKYLEWYWFPLKCINIDMGNVVVIRLPNSKLEILWEGIKSLKKLRILDVSYSYSLIRTGSFYGLENLEELNLGGCKNLEELHNSIGCLDKLVNLDLSHCTRLQSIANFPRNLRSIDASNCISLMNVPSNMSELEFLTKLDLGGCSKLGSDPECLKKVTGLRNLETLSMKSCNVSHVPSEIGNLVSLRVLNLSRNTFSSLPDSFNNLLGLVSLLITECSRLQLLPLLPSNLKIIESRRCWSLAVMPVASKQTTNISLCAESMWRRNSFPYEFSREVLQMYKKPSFISQLQIRLPRAMIPKWCNYQGTGHILSFEAPQHLERKICGMILCVAILRGYSCVAKIHNKTKEMSYRLREMYAPGSEREGEMWVMFFGFDDTTLVVGAGDNVELELENKNVECGLCLIYKDDEDDGGV